MSGLLQAVDLRAGMDIFNIQQPPYKELVNTERDLDFLEKIWGIVQEWQSSYNGWKDGKFRDINVGSPDGYPPLQSIHLNVYVAEICWLPKKNM